MEDGKMEKCAKQPLNNPYKSTPKHICARMHNHKQHHHILGTPQQHETQEGKERVYGH